MFWGICQWGNSRIVRLRTALASSGLLSAIILAARSTDALATQQRPVLILDRENPISGLRERFDRLGVQDGENFKVWGGWLPEEAPAPNSVLVRSWVQAC